MELTSSLSALAGKTAIHRRTYSLIPIREALKVLPVCIPLPRSRSFGRALVRLPPFRLGPAISTDERKISLAETKNKPKGNGNLLSYLIATIADILAAASPPRA